MCAKSLSHSLIITSRQKFFLWRWRCKVRPDCVIVTSKMGWSKLPLVWLTGLLTDWLSDWLTIFWSRRLNCRCFAPFAYRTSARPCRPLTQTHKHGERNRSGSINPQNEVRRRGTLLTFRINCPPISASQPSSLWIWNPSNSPHSRNRFQLVLYSVKMGFEKWQYIFETFIKSDPLYLSNLFHPHTPSLPLLIDFWKRQNVLSTER